jgi:hypothetical protein
MRLPSRAASLLLALVLASVFTSGFSLKEWRSSLYDTVKQQAEGQFSLLFNRSVTIESAGGLIVGEIDLINFFVPGIGRSDRVRLTYNPLKYAFAKGDMVQALYKITVINGNFKVERNGKGEFTILSSFSSGGGNAAPPAFRGRIVFRIAASNTAITAVFTQLPLFLPSPPIRSTARSICAKKIRSSFHSPPSCRRSPRSRAPST